MCRRQKTMGTAAYYRRSKWAAMVASVWIQCTSGSSYCFGVYSPLIKSSQSYDQSTLDSVAFFKDVGGNIGVLSGFLYSFGGVANPMLVLSAGAVQCFAGYFMMWLSVTGVIPRPSPGLMCFYMFLAAHSQTFFNTADVVTAVENFPDSRGTVVGIMKNKCWTERTMEEEDCLEVGFDQYIWTKGASLRAPDGMCKSLSVAVVNADVEVVFHGGRQNNYEHCVHCLRQEDMVEYVLFCQA